MARVLEKHHWQDTIINLDPAGVVASGIQRDVYLHPTNDTLLIKVLKRAADMPVRTNFNGRMDRLFPSTRLRQVRIEYQEYIRVMLDHAETPIHLPISHMYGFVQTNLGLGCLTQRVKDADGGIGQTLGRMIKDRTLTDADLGLLNDSVARIYDHNIRASDMTANNFVFGTRGNGPRECVLVDGFGDIHAIPVRSMSRWSNHKGLDDSCRRMESRNPLKWDPETRHFTKA